MKRIYLIISTLFALQMGAQTIQNGSYSTTGYIKPDGTIQNSSYSTTGYIKKDGTIQNSSYSTIGYIKSDGTIQNSSYSTVGYVKKDGTVQNSSYSTIGYIKDDGTVQNSSYSTIGYAKNVKKPGRLWCFSFSSLIKPPSSPTRTSLLVKEGKIRPSKIILQLLHHFHRNSGSTVTSVMEKILHSDPLR